MLTVLSIPPNPAMQQLLSEALADFDDACADEGSDQAQSSPDDGRGVRGSVGEEDGSAVLATLSEPSGQSPGVLTTYGNSYTHAVGEARTCSAVRSLEDGGAAASPLISSARHSISGGRGTGGDASFTESARAVGSGRPHAEPPSEVAGCGGGVFVLSCIGVAAPPVARERRGRGGILVVQGANCGRHRAHNRGSARTARRRVSAELRRLDAELRTGGRQPPAGLALAVMDPLAAYMRRNSPRKADRRRMDRRWIAANRRRERRNPESHPGLTDRQRLDVLCLTQGGVTEEVRLAARAAAQGEPRALQRLCADAAAEGKIQALRRRLGELQDLAVFTAGDQGEPLDQGERQEQRVGGAAALPTGGASGLRRFLSAPSRRLLDEPNAGGSSSISEAFSLELLARDHGAVLIRTERELQDLHPSHAPPDYTARIGEHVYAVSVTRAMGTPRVSCMDFNARSACDLLQRKLRRLMLMRAGHEWDRGLLHVWAESVYVAQLMHDALEHGERYGMIPVSARVLITTAPIHLRAMFEEGMGYPRV